MSSFRKPYIKLRDVNRLLEKHIISFFEKCLNS